MVSASAYSDKLSTEIRELKEIVLCRNEKIRELRLHGAEVSLYVFLAAILAILLRVVHTKRGETDLGACRVPGSLREAYSGGPSTSSQQ